MEPGEVLPLTLRTDEGKPEGRYFQFICKTYFLTGMRIACTAQIKY
jgi:hypothetical protein